MAHVTTAHQQQSQHLGSDAARVLLRHTLATYFHAQPVAAPRGYHSWPSPALPAVSNSCSPPKLGVGDPIVLMVRSVCC
jgi:hypothetical protein